MSRRPSVFQDGNIGPEIGGRGLAQQSNELNYRRERDAALMKQQKKQNEFDLGMKIIDDAKVADSGLNPVDAIKNKAIPALQSEAFRRLQAGESAMSLKAWLDPQVAKLNEAYVTAKNSKAIIDDNLKQIAKDYDGGDIAKVKTGAYTDATNDILEMDGDGNYVGIKDVSVIPHDKNYTSRYLEPQNLGSWYNASGQLKDFAEGLKLNDISDNDKYDDKGRVIKHGYKGKENFLSQKIIDPKTGDVIGQETVHEIVKDKDGNEIKVLPQVQEQQILSNPRRAAELNQIVASELAAVQLSTGKPITEEEAHLYMRNRLYQLMDKYKTHTFNKNDEVKIPKPPVYNSHTTINMGQGPTVRQMYTGIREKVESPETEAITVGNRYLGKTMNALESDERAAVIAEYEKATGEKDVPSDQLFLRVDGNDLRVYKFDPTHPKPTEKTTVEEAKNFQLPETFVTISKEGTDIKAQVRTKDKAEVVKENQGQQPKPKAVPAPAKSKYVKVVEYNGQKWGQKADGSIEKVQ